MKKMIAQGAEAKLYLEDNKITKERIKKGYRLTDLDLNIRKKNTRRENKLLEKSSFLIPVPKVYEFNDKSMKIIMDYIPGKTVRDILDNLPKKERINLCEQIGRQVALIHNSSIIHGDLTTSNFILKKDTIYFIDFGLGFFSDKVEDKAVDIHLLKQAFESKHYNNFEEHFKAFLAGYKEKSNNFKGIMERFNKVEKRGRYKRKSH